MDGERDEVGCAHCGWYGRFDDLDIDGKVEFCPQCRHAEHLFERDEPRYQLNYWVGSHQINTYQFDDLDVAKRKYLDMLDMLRDMKGAGAIVDYAIRLDDFKNDKTIWKKANGTHLCSLEEIVEEIREQNGN